MKEYILSFDYTRPQLIRQGAATWLAQKTWNWEHFRAMRTSLAPMGEGVTGNSTRLAVGQYVERILQHPPVKEKRYLSGWRFYEEHHQMLMDFKEPFFSYGDRLLNIPSHILKPLLWIFIGNTGTGTSLHYDVLQTHAWIAIIEGVKRIVLHPPQNQAPLRAVCSTGWGDNDDPWLNFTLTKGDLFFIPSGWWHEVVNESPGIALTRNFVTADIVECVHNAAYCSGYTRLLQWLE